MCLTYYALYGKYYCRAPLLKKGAAPQLKRRLHPQNVRRDKPALQGRYPTVKVG